MSTARDIVTLALKEAGVTGVGQTPLAEEINDGYTYLRRMLAQWAKRRWLIPALYTVSALGNGAKSNTVGPGGYFNTDIRPSKISSAYFIQNNTGGNPVSLPLRPLFSHEDYDRINVKDLATLPQYFFYDNAWADGFGNVFIWPVPDATYTIYLTIMRALGFPNADDGLDSEFNLPEEYEEPIHYQLTLRFCAGWQLQPSTTQIALGRVGLNFIKNNNLQIPELQMPAGMKSPTGFNLYNPDGY